MQSNIIYLFIYLFIILEYDGQLEFGLFAKKSVHPIEQRPT